MDVPAFAGTSVSHCTSLSLFAPFQPQRLTHSCFSSSHTVLSFRFFWIPFAFANCSHLVGGFGLGRGLARGSCVVGGGRCANGPSSVEVVGREKSEAMRVCTPSRAVDMRYSSRSALKMTPVNPLKSVGRNKKDGRTYS